MKNQRTKTRIKFLSRDEVERLTMQARDVKESALMHTLFSTGLRVAECVALQRSDLEHPDLDRTKELSIVGKGGYQRVVFFSPMALGAIAAYLTTRSDTDSRLFPIDVRTAQRIVSRCAKAAGLAATPHTFRHSLATHLLKQGANIRIVQEMLGHRALSSTMVYTGVANKDLLEAHTKFV